MARFSQIPQEIDAFTFPAAVEIRLLSTPATPLVEVLVSDYLLFVDGSLKVMTKKDFHKNHNPVSVELMPPPEVKTRAPKTRKPRESKRGINPKVLGQQDNGTVTTGEAAAE